MKILIDAHNTISAGASLITATFVRQAVAAAPSGDTFVILLPDIPLFGQFKGPLPEHVSIRFIRQHAMPLQLAERLWTQAVTLPLALLRHRPDAVFVFGNYFLPPWKNKTVFMQTAYIVDDRLLAEAGGLARLQERVVRTLFRMTVRSARTIVVQNEEMRAQLAARCPKQAAGIAVLPTPISEKLSALGRKQARSFPAGRKLALYISRYYPHKNHRFLLAVAERFRREFEERGLGFVVTVDPAVGPEARAFLDTVRQRGLDPLITNRGEIGQEQLAGLYDEAFALFFPSRAESFGLPLAEAMAFGLPVVVPDLPYARSLCGPAGNYYADGDPADAARRLIELCDRPEAWQAASLRSVEQIRSLPSAEEWYRALVRVMLQREQ
ncbi:MAG: glycosyltransferase [Nitrospiraceae bacterium]|nr:glycosyltransferase [Nitrospiraceae bacterium]